MIFSHYYFRSQLILINVIGIQNKIYLYLINFITLFESTFHRLTKQFRYFLLLTPKFDNHTTTPVSIAFY